MNAALTPQDRDRLVKVLALLGSDKDGERAAAGFMAARMLRDRGLDWQSVITPADRPMRQQPQMPRPARAPTRSASASYTQIMFLLRNSAHLNNWEAEFLRSTANRARLTFKQIEVLDRMYDRLVGEGVR